MMSSTSFISFHVVTSQPTGYCSVGWIVPYWKLRERWASLKEGLWELNNSGCSLLHEARTKAQKRYLASVIYSTCRVDLNCYFRPGRYSCPMKPVTIDVSKVKIYLLKVTDCTWCPLPIVLGCLISCKQYIVYSLQQELKHKSASHTTSLQCSRQLNFTV